MINIANNIMSYTIDFVPFTALLDKDSRNAMFHFAKWIDDQSGDQFATRNIIQTVDYLKNPRFHMITKSMCEFVWYVVLKNNGKVVCVAFYQKSMEITTITTAKNERGKGHAVYLMTYLRELFETHGVKVICPAEHHILPILAKAGWTVATKIINPDGTIDTMPEYVKEEYIRTTKTRPVRPINERSIDKVFAFMEFLPTLNAPVPKV